MPSWRNWGLSLLVIFLLLFLPGCAQGGGNSQAGASSAESLGSAVVEGEIPLPPPARSLKGKAPAQPPAKFQLKSASTKDIALDLTLGADTMEYSLAAGWNTISFPFNALKSITGLNYYLYYWDGSQYQMVDPANAVKIDCQKGYWAYSDEAATILVKGHFPSSHLNPILHQGWNLFAYPKTQALGESSLTYNGESKTIADAISAGWIGSRIIYYQDGAWRFLSCNNGSLQQGPGYWLWSQVEGAVFNPAPPNPAADQVINQAITALRQNQEDDFVQLCGTTVVQSSGRELFALLTAEERNSFAQALEQATVIYQSPEDEGYRREYRFVLEFRGERSEGVITLEKDANGNWKITHM